MEPLLKTVKLGVTFNKGKPNEYVALKDINIEIYPNEYIIFFGPSGSGKSTLLYLLLGLLKPTAGEIYIKGKPYSTFKEREKNIRTSQMFGMVFQQYNLLFSLNVFDNVILPQVFVNASPRVRKPKAIELLRRFGIEARAKQSPAMLSGGQQQRVAVCRALINNPDIVLADEPVGNLDSESAKIVMDTLKDINVKDKKTVILVTHDARYLPYADRVYFFKDARIEREERMSVGGPGNGPGGATASPTIDLERLARAHPSLSAAQLKAWSLSNWLTEELTVEQMERLEGAMEKILSGKISPHQFFESLDMPFADGGVGLYRQTAVSFAKRVVHIMNEMRLYGEQVKNEDDPKKRARLVNMLRFFLLEEHKGNLAPEELDLLSAAIEARVVGKMSHADFVQKLSKNPSEQGVGLVQTVADRLAERLDLIISKI
jgi:putative ABC transport system ATP-binding protein